jgi:predicted dinucleotide-binding enzyme
MSRKIGIIGSGAVARTLGSGFLQHGFQVMLGSRDPSKLAGAENIKGATIIDATIPIGKVPLQNGALHFT